MKLPFVSSLLIAILANQAAASTVCEANLGDDLAAPPGVTYPPITNDITAPNGHDDNLAFLVGGDFISLAGAEVEGKMVVIGDMVVEAGGVNSLVQVGAGSGVYPNGGDIIKIGGNVETKRNVAIVSYPGSNGAGNVIYKGTFNAQGSTGVWEIGQGGSIFQDPNLDLSPYVDLLADLVAKSDQWAALPSTGVFAEAYGTITLTAGNNDCVQVFNFPASFWSGFSFGAHVDIDASLSGKTLLFNVPAFPPTANDPRKIAVVENVGSWEDPQGYSGFQLTPGDAANILWNFYDADFVELGNNKAGNGQFPGTVLVPRGGMEFSYPGSQGRIIVGGDLTQNKPNSEFHNYPFDPEAQCPLPPPPVCDSTESPTSAPTPCVEGENVELVMKVGDTHWTGDIPIEVVTQSTTSVTFKLKQTWATSLLDYYYVSFEDTNMNGVCYLEENVTTTDTFMYTAKCTGISKEAIIDIIVTDQSFNASLDVASPPDCCHKPDEDTNPAVQYCFEISCVPKCPEMMPYRSLAEERSFLRG